MRKIDSITIRSRVFENPIVLLVRDDQVIEIYVEENGLERYAGVLSARHSNDMVKVKVMLEAIRKRIAEQPISSQSLAWLLALDCRGLLRLWEEELA